MPPSSIRFGFTLCSRYSLSIFNITVAVLSNRKIPYDYSGIEPLFSHICSDIEIIFQRLCVLNVINVTGLEWLGRPVKWYNVDDLYVAIDISNPGYK